MNIDKILTKATHGQITAAERQYAAEVAESQCEDSYSALMILGRAEAKQYRTVVEEILHSSRDPMLVRAAVYVLCQCWDDTRRYVNEIHDFCNKVAWDVGDDVRLIAISSAGEFLRSEADPRLAKCLLNIAENEEDEIARDAAKAAIARAMGQEYKDIPSPVKLAKLGSSSLDPFVAAFKSRLGL